MTFEKYLKIYIESAVPIININTREPSRAINSICRVVEKVSKDIKKSDNPHLDLYLKSEGYKIYAWSITRGWENITTLQTETGTSADLGNALRFFLSEEAQAGVYILSDMQLLMNPIDIPAGKYPQYIQLLKDAFNIGKISNKHLILISNGWQVPVELSDLIVSLEFGLPSRETIITFIKDYVTDSLSPASPDLKEIENIGDVAVGMTLNEVENAVTLAMYPSKGKRIDREIVLNEKVKIIKQRGLLEFIDNPESIDNIAGLDNLKEYLIKTSKVFKEMGKAKKYNLPIPKGFLTVGIQGCGKTLLAQATASLFGLPLFRCDIGRLFDSLLGHTERNARELIKLIDTLAPCVVILDEVEKSVSGVKSSAYTEGGVTDKVVGTLLYWMQERTAPAYLVLTCNNIQLLPPEFIRAGRLDTLWWVDLPTMTEREDAFRIHLKKVKRNPDNFEPISVLAKLTNGYTGAEIESIIKNAMLTAFYEDREFTINDIKRAIKDTSPVSKVKKHEIDLLKVKVNKWGIRAASKGESLHDGIRTTSWGSLESEKH
jgi:AAA+ superfamily predicted ATPase